jgi:Arc/MetJ-type ribon-helix-helix transcriptional regulator
MPVVDDPNPGNKTSTWAAAAGVVGKPGYDPTKFFTHASDSRGHSERLTVKFPPEVLREVMVLVESGGFTPYQFSSDFIRDAVHHHLHNRSAQIGDPVLRERFEGFFVLRDAQEQLEAATRASVLWGDQLEGWEAAFTQFAKDGAWPQVWYHALLAIKVVERAPEPYRSNLLTMLSAWASKVPEEFRTSDVPEVRGQSEDDSANGDQSQDSSS